MAFNLSEEILNGVPQYPKEIRDTSGKLLNLNSYLADLCGPNGLEEFCERVRPGSLRLEMNGYE